MDVFVAVEEQFALHVAEYGLFPEQKLAVK